MKYSALHKSIIVETDDLNRSIDGILWAMKKYRLACNVPLTKRQNKKGHLSDFDLAERELLQGLKTIGIDMGADWGKDLDLSDAT
jgi:hypothetical protein